MRKSLITMSLAAAMAVAAPVGITNCGNLTTYSHAVAAQEDGAASVDNMKRLNLIIRKLRDAMGSMKDFDELEKAGLSKRDVDRMRDAMREKINQMMEDAIYAIRNL